MYSNALSMETLKPQDLNTRVIMRRSSVTDPEFTVRNRIIETTTEEQEECDEAGETQAGETLKLTAEVKHSSNNTHFY